MTTTPIIINGTSTALKDLKKKNKMRAVIHIESTKNKFNSFLTLSAITYLEYGKPAYLNSIPVLFTKFSHSDKISSIKPSLSGEFNIFLSIVIKKFIAPEEFKICPE